MNQQLSISTCIAILITFQIALLTLAEESPEKLDVKITQITDDIKQQEGPQIWGDNIVWIETPNPEPSYNNREVKLNNINNKETIQITNISNEYEDHRYSDIYGEIIAWNLWSADPDLGPNGLFIYNISTGLTEQIAKNYSAWVPKIYRENIVFIDGTMLYVNLTKFNEIGRDIGIYNMKTQEVTIICNAIDNQTNPDIWENYIVWEDYRNGQSDIYLFDLNTMMEERITNTPENETEPMISGKNIVWDNGPEIECYNIANKTIFKRIEGGLNVIYNDLVLIAFYNEPVTLFNISSGKDYILSNVLDGSHEWDLYENKLVYTHHTLETNIDDVYLLEFNFIPDTDGNNTNNTDDDKSHNNLSIPSATMSFLVMSIILIAIIRRKK